jgi:hypothetical protein
MAMEFHATDDPRNVEVRDERGKIGALFYADADEEDPTEGWMMELHGFRFGSSRSTRYFPTGAEAVDAARPLYDELREHRQYVARVQARLRFISLPMGGQPK